MMNLIPLSFLSKMGNYDIEIEGANVKVSIVDNPALIGAKMDELRSSLQTSERQVVGLDIKFVKTDGNLKNKGKFLLLCVGSHCLMIQLPDSETISDTLGKFLSDETICFLGTGMSKIVSELGSLTYGRHVTGSKVAFGQSVNFKTGVEVGFLAAKILKKPNVENHGLVELAGEVGMDIKEPIGECPDWNAKVFSNEEVKYAVHNAYTSYVIGNKLFDML
nr:uncharacterized protein LOC112010495 [Quercus suber]XP_023898605.1 uncharacterized protein LOC112010495 [Quercus suber]XP_023898606.1 uncharacterized protein LOC112010495 [Quercus suber]XP_023898607.1 uncharacterized protein LOC112010495 [Quercus suber]XP_023898608.1 uncharacterized protein LOC112010495 [Quercus suber]